MKNIATWYFDFVSPFAYLQWQRIKRISGVDVHYRPVLFAALLNHHGNLGPAELATKRKFSYRHVQWRADRDGIALRFPPTHPFNPLPALRLCMAAGTTRESIDTIFDFVWRDGNSIDTPGDMDALAKRLDIGDAAVAIANPAIKLALAQNFEQAVADGVFGVPSILLNSELFWGEDATDMFEHYLEDPGLFQTEDMRRLEGLPVGAMRKLPRL